MAGAVGWTVAVDFGTAFSKAAVAPRDAGGAAIEHARPLRVGAAARARDPHLVPSALFLQDGHAYFGPEAVDRAQRSNVGKREALQSFKLLLGTNDLEAFLPSKPSRRIDPDGAFNYHELISLFLAYFLGLIESTLKEDPRFGDEDRVVWRYTRPGWFSDRTERDHRQTVQLFRRGAGLLAELPPRFWTTPLSYATLRAALNKNASAAIEVEAGVFEATSALAAYLPDVGGSVWSMIVIDMGAGTTDFGSYLSTPGKSGAQLKTLDHTIALAGDDIDRALLNLIIQKAEGFESARDLGGLWRHLLPTIRARKEEIFATGELHIEFYGRSVACSIRELEKSRDYRAIVGAISKDFRRILERTIKTAASYSVPETVVITSGGGARLPFVAEIVRKAAAKRRAVPLRVGPRQPSWVDNSDVGREIGPIFNQLAIAIGGAMAAKEMLIGVNAKVDA